MTVLDQYDEAVYAEAFRLADAVRRFLARRSTARLAKAGVFDDDVYSELVAADHRMSMARAERIAAARGEQLGFDG